MISSDKYIPTVIRRAKRQDEPISLPKPDVNKKYYLTKLFKEEIINVTGPCEIRVKDYDRISGKIELLFVLDNETIVLKENQK
jgi:hypothetical protein